MKAQYIITALCLSGSLFGVVYETKPIKTTQPVRVDSGYLIGRTDERNQRSIQVTNNSQMVKGLEVEEYRPVITNKDLERFSLGYGQTGIIKSFAPDALRKLEFKNGNTVAAEFFGDGQIADKLMLHNRDNIPHSVVLTYANGSQEIIRLNKHMHSGYRQTVNIGAQSHVKQVTFAENGDLSVSLSKNQ